jgi:zinc protease
MHPKNLLRGVVFTLSAFFAPFITLAQTPATMAAQMPEPRPWLYVNSDVPMDPAWRFGTLDNGLRFAIRRNGVPPGQISIRVRVDVGSLMERSTEKGFAHFLEHLTFRGSRHVPDGEAKRVWQRLGASFGTDSNAQTTPTHTVYALDLPQADDAGIDESMKILAGMMAQPNIVASAVDAERAVVMAERRESLGPGSRIGDATRKLYFAGQPLADHSPIGTEATLAGATASALQAFHTRWYRPERVVIAISGDIDPEIMESYVRRHFSAWSAEGPAAPTPSFGRPNPSAPAAAVIVEPSAPYSVGLAMLRPWLPRADTVAYNRRRLVDVIALQLINRRLEAAASDGGSFLVAEVRQDDTSRSVDGTYIAITPSGPDWRRALRDVRAIIEDAKQTAPDKADIDREYAAQEAGFVQLAENASVESSATQAEMLVGAVDIAETTVSPQTQLDIFRSARQFMTPEQIRDATRRLLTGTATRALLTLKSPQAGALAQLNQAVAAPVAPARGVRVSTKAVTMDDLPALPTPGKVASSRSIGALGIQQIVFENGVSLLFYPTDAEPEKVRINVRFGLGQKSFSPAEDNALWTAPFALMAAGIGNLDSRALDQLTNGRQLALTMNIDEDAFEFESVTRPADMRDQLRLYAAKLMAPRWDAAPLNRIKASLAAGWTAQAPSAEAAMGRDLPRLLRAGDRRFAPADPASADAMTSERFRAIWEPRLASGPIEVLIFGNVDQQAAVDAVAATLGALPRRNEAAASEGNNKLAFPAPVTTPVVLRHSGLSEQAAAVIAWPTGGGLAGAQESRRLEVLGQIINDRLFERLRSVDGAAYTPSASSSWSFAYDQGGYLLISTQLKPERIAYFYTLAGEIARDLATKPVNDDELSRIITPMRQLVLRASTGNSFWMNQLEGYSRDKRYLDAMRNLSRDLLEVTAGELQVLAARYLVPGSSWSAIALANGVAVPTLAVPGSIYPLPTAPTASAPAPTPTQSQPATKQAREKVTTRQR